MQTIENDFYRGHEDELFALCSTLELIMFNFYVDANARTWCRQQTNEKQKFHRRKVLMILYGCSQSTCARRKRFGWMKERRNPIFRLFHDFDLFFLWLPFTGFAFHSDRATFYKIVEDEFNEREICQLSEIPLFPEQHMMAIVQKGSPLRKAITYG